MKRWWLLLAALPLFTAAASDRVVSLGGDVTEIVYGLDAQNTLVGRDTTSTWPEAANSLPNVGYLRQLNAEGILALRPTLVLASAQAQPSQVLTIVADNNVRLVTVPGGYSLAAIGQKIDVIAAALGKADRGAALHRQLEREIAALHAPALNKRVMFLLSHGGMGTLVSGQQTAADAAIRAAGLRNAMQGFDHYRPMSQEGVIASQPDLIVISADGVKALGGEANIWRLPGLAQTPAGRNKQVMIVDDVALLSFGLRTPGAIQALRHYAERLP
ncbi:hemin ABC transporter substrate-binding protein [Shimwellia pseudoproteus]|uniref:heme/hemin ABC transporter substrate-binding protein n=1 Tax=Shimwellia pseudoproteus TaxID=570012 RepID=UPI0018ED9D22|nr:hemin ABC transporter substrate-binding protein [Shimwellia pseudoproteus]MBJ3814464.1 hemin ABC transporter substrate-binding protein [Shimwellia pseudoproteus]